MHLYFHKMVMALFSKKARRLKNRRLNYLSSHYVKGPEIWTGNNRNAPSELNLRTYIVTEERMSYAHCKIWTCLNDFLTKISSADNFESGLDLRLCAYAYLLSCK